MPSTEEIQNYKFSIRWIRRYVGFQRNFTFFTNPNEPAIADYLDKYGWFFPGPLVPLHICKLIHKLCVCSTNITYRTHSQSQQASSWFCIQWCRAQIFIYHTRWFDESSRCYKTHNANQIEYILSNITTKLIVIYFTMTRRLSTMDGSMELLFRRLHSWYVNKAVPSDFSTRGYKMSHCVVYL